MPRSPRIARSILGCAAAFAVLGCRGDAVYDVGPSGPGFILIAAEQSDLCHRDCSTAAAQGSPLMRMFLGHRGDGGVPEGPVGPGTYLRPPADDGSPSVLQWEIGGVCDDPGPLHYPTGTVTITQMPSGPGTRLEGSYRIETGGTPDFPGGSFSARSCN